MLSSIFLYRSVTSSIVVGSAVSRSSLVVAGVLSRSVSAGIRFVCTWLVVSFVTVATHFGEVVVADYIFRLVVVRVWASHEGDRKHYGKCDKKEVKSRFHLWSDIND